MPIPHLKCPAKIYISSYAKIKLANMRNDFFLSWHISTFFRIILNVIQILPSFGDSIEEWVYLVQGYMCQSYVIPKYFIPSEAPYLKT